MGLWVLGDRVAEVTSLITVQQFALRPECRVEWEECDLGLRMHLRKAEGHLCARDWVQKARLPSGRTPHIRDHPAGHLLWGGCLGTPVDIPQPFLEFWVPGSASVLRVIPTLPARVQVVTLDPSLPVLGTLPTPGEGEGDSSPGCLSDFSSARACIIGLEWDGLVSL